ncbi:hypothetical protein PIB30_055837 [Stylosanthes scabra]|uniref:Uncharacterized protein n=1 Tax=Stylosanthes scabra TaxID=79078 RepID=A0ABU6YLM4_9FABA|nr:hypothetical protein [Stylosanthes scabra]
MLLCCLREAAPPPPFREVVAVAVNLEERGCRSSRRKQGFCRCCDVTEAVLFGHYSSDHRKQYRHCRNPLLPWWLLSSMLLATVTLFVDDDAAMGKRELLPLLRNVVVVAVVGQ